MKKEIIINSSLNEMRIAIAEDGKLSELFVESPDNERVVGNIYFGKVSKVMQGINAAFVNIGTKHDAFLHFSDVDDTLENFDADDENEQKAELVGKVKNEVPQEDKSNPEQKKNGKVLPHFKTKRMGDIGINLQAGQNVVVQIVREAYSTKGVRVSTRIGLAGRYVVVLPYDNIIGISKKISIQAERRRLRSLAKTYLPKGVGCIIRTVSAGKNEEELVSDYKNLVGKWQEIEKKMQTMTRPGLLYQDAELVTSVIRDLFTNDVERVAVDSKRLYKEITSYLRFSAPKLYSRVEYFNGKGHIFDYFGVSKQIESSYGRKIFLASGGSIVIDQTEAMFIIDINSGRLMTDEQEQNALKTNLEAVKEIARQIRLRDMSGMILIDFIDLNFENDRKRIFLEMKKELFRDRAKTVVYPLTQLCIMQITRQRVNQYIAEKVSEVCPLCEGSGRIASKAIIVNNIESWIRNFRTKSDEFRLTLVVHPWIAIYLTEGSYSRLARLMIKYVIKISVLQSEQVNYGEFKFLSEKTGLDITKEYESKDA